MICLNDPIQKDALAIKAIIVMMMAWRLLRTIEVSKYMHAELYTKYTYSVLYGSRLK